MKLGIIGLPSAGKTTIFNALTGGDAPTGSSMGGRFDVLQAVVDVPDERVNVLKKMFNPKKTTYARVNYTDIAGLKKGVGDGGLSGALLNHLSGLDGFVHVVRAFESEMVPHADGSVDAMRDFEALNMEFLLNDLVIVEGRLQRLADNLRKGAVKDKGKAKVEERLLARLNETLSDEQPLRNMLDTLSEEEVKSLRGYGFLTMKPQLIIVNIDDEQDEVTIESETLLTRVVNLRGRLEMELGQMKAEGDAEGLEMFMEEYGVVELGLGRAIFESYELMGLQSFFTVGEDEVRAWTVKRQAPAVQAAGTIHSDLAKGFIRAEVVGYDDLIELGSMAAARTAGKFRLEGKTYPVQDGDILNIKFNL